MNDEDKDPYVQQWFVRAHVELDDSTFTDRVAQRMSSWRRRRLAVHIAACLATLAVAATLHESAVAVAAFFTRSVVELAHPVVASLLAPVNSVGGLVALSIIGLRIVRRRLLG
jgi:hypothetical protein